MPTICSTCGRTSGKCESCIRPDAAPDLRAAAHTALDEWRKVRAQLPYIPALRDAMWDLNTALAAPSAVAADDARTSFDPKLPGAMSCLTGPLGKIQAKCRVGYMMSKGTAQWLAEAVAIAEAAEASVATIATPLPAPAVAEPKTDSLAFQYRREVVEKQVAGMRQPELKPSPLMRQCGVHADSESLASACASVAKPAVAAEAGQGEREAFEAFAQNCPMGRYSVDRKGEGYWSSHTQIMWDTWQARAALAPQPAPPSQGQWLPIETAPKDGSYILVSNDHGAWIAHWAPIATSGYRFYRPWRSCMLNHDHIDLSVRHLPPTKWMPLPAAPTQPPAEGGAE